MRVHARTLGSRAALPPRLRAAHPVVRAAPPRRRAAAVRADAGGDDPYKVLGVPRNATSEQVQRAYTRKRSDAKGDEAALAALEAAHSALMMRALTARLAGKTPVQKDVLYADRARFFPWRPRLWLAGRSLLAYAGAAQAALLAWALLSPLTAGTQPVVYSAVAGGVANVFKQNAINPPPARGGELNDAERAQGGKNIVRGAFLAFLATFAGCFLFYTAPDAAAAAAGRVLPLWFYEGQSMLLALGSCTLNFLFTALFR